MWNVVRASVRGSVHKRAGTPCQDAASLRVLGDTIVIAISDGAGSASHSDQGASTAVAAALSFIEKILTDSVELNPETGVAILDSCRTALFELSKKLAIDVRELSCTLLFAVVQANCAFFGQLGDGAWILTYGSSLIPATWPVRGTYANETSFLTSENWSSACEFAKFLGPIESIAGFTDGIQALALHYASRSVFEPFFQPILRVLSKSPGKDVLNRELEEYLSSAAIANRSDDDRTLVVATKNRRRLLTDGTN
jgi:hypothetical protein